MITKNELKELKKLTLKKYRNNSDQLLVEGKRIIEQVLANGFFPEIVFIDEEKREVKSLIEKSKRGIIEYVPFHVISQLTETKSPQEIVAVFRKPKLKFPPEGNFIYLDNLRDPGNMGTIFRTAAAFNIDGIYISPDSCEVLSPKVIRASLGAVFSVPFVIAELTTLEVPECDIFSTELEGELLGEIDNFNKNMIIIIGNEANGISQANRDLATRKITIPVSSQMESLNASVAASITIYNLLWKKYGNCYLNR